MQSYSKVVNMQNFSLQKEVFSPINSTKTHIFCNFAFMNGIYINKEKCTRCGRCYTVCSSYVLAQDGKGSEIEVVRPDMCIGCGQCVCICPTEAFHHSGVEDGSIRKIERELLPSPEGVLELIRSRRSNRTMTDKDIPQRSLEMIQEAARCAPTAENSRNVTVRLITDGELLSKIENKVMHHFMMLAKPLMWKPVKALLQRFSPTLYKQALELSLMNEKRQRGLRPATVDCRAILLITAPKKSRFGYQDCNLAYQNASLMAESLGVSQVYLGFVQTAFEMWGVKKTARLLGLPKREKVFAIMALGMPALRYDRYVSRQKNM